MTKMLVSLNNSHKNKPIHNMTDIDNAYRFLNECKRSILMRCVLSPGTIYPRHLVSEAFGKTIISVPVIPPIFPGHFGIPFPLNLTRTFQFVVMGAFEDWPRSTVELLLLTPQEFGMTEMSFRMWREAFIAIRDGLPLGPQPVLWPPPSLPGRLGSVTISRPF